MRSPEISSPSRFVFLLFVLAGFLLFFGCATTPKDDFTKRLRNMPDTELIAYYNGISERLKTIDNRTRDMRSAEPRREPENSFNGEFYYGSPGYDLMQKQKQVEKELKWRNLAP